MRSPNLLGAEDTQTLAPEDPQPTPLESCILSWLPMAHGKSKPQRPASGSSCPVILERAPHRSDGRNRRRGKQRSGCGKLAAAALAVAIVVVAAAYFLQHGR